MTPLVEFPYVASNVSESISYKSSKQSRSRSRVKAAQSLSQVLASKKLVSSVSDASPFTSLYYRLCSGRFKKQRVFSYSKWRFGISIIAAINMTQITSTITNVKQPSGIELLDWYPNGSATLQIVFMKSSKSGMVDYSVFHIDLQISIFFLNMDQKVLKIDQNG